MAKIDENPGYEKVNAVLSTHPPDIAPTARRGEITCPWIASALAKWREKPQMSPPNKAAEIERGTLQHDSETINRIRQVLRTPKKAAAIVLAADGGKLGEQAAALDPASVLPRAFAATDFKGKFGAVVRMFCAPAGSTSTASAQSASARPANLEEYAG